MINIQRSGQKPLEIEFILIDFEGTLARDRRVHPKAKDKINLLAKRAKIYIFSKGEKEEIMDLLRKAKAEIVFLKEGETSQAKLDLLRQLGPLKAAAIGNGYEEATMIEEA